jgi:hypothetical protein
VGGDRTFSVSPAIHEQFLREFGARCPWVFNQWLHDERWEALFVKNQRRTIRKIVSALNNAEEDGGLWLPNIQRPFVWDEDQICRLFDSILREYPISTLLVWKTTSNIRHRRFIDSWKDSLRQHISDFYVTENYCKKT